jgi:aspartyl/asparaginyl beta-hydroxylase (cupin superfamily)
MKPIFIVIIILIVLYIVSNYLTKNKIKWQGPLTQQWRIIRDEAINRMATSKVHSGKRPKYWTDIDMKDITNKWISGPEAQGDEWINYGLWVNGKPILDNCNKCPETYKLLQKAIELGANIKVAGFSWLKPKSKIPPHTDPNDDTVYHLGIVVPKGDECYIDTNNRKIIHKNGKWLTFDDRKVHSAINDTDRDRVILYLLIG